MRTVLSLPKFVKELGFCRANEKDFHKHFNHLLKIKAIELQQGGFLGDSMHHHKLVVIRDLAALQRHFQKAFIIPEEEFGKEEIVDVHAERRVIAHVKAEKNVEYCRVGQVGRTVYMELNLKMIRRHNIKKGDIIKYSLLELRRAPEEDAKVQDPGELG
jgi:hypothetical protein